MDNKLHDIRLVVGRSNPQLSQLVADNLKIVSHGVCTTFGNGELNVAIKENIRGCKVFILQTGGGYDGMSVNDYLMELMLLIDACRRSDAKHVTVIIPCFPYARADKKDTPRVAISSAVVVRMLQSVGCDRICSVDLHSGQIQGVFNRAFDNLYAIDIHIANLKRTLFAGMTHEAIDAQYVLGSPDNGGAKRVEAYAGRLGMQFVVMHKQRDYSKISCVTKTMIIGAQDELVGKTVIIIDDIVDTMGTMISAADQLAEFGVKSVIVVATHGVFSGPAFERVNGCDMIEKVIVTNTLCQIKNQQLCRKIEVVDISGLLSETISRLANGGSISGLFHQ